MWNKIKEVINKNKLFKIVTIVLVVPICVYTASEIFGKGTEFGTFIRKLVELTNC